MASEFHNLLVAHLPRMRAYAMMLTRDGAAADDLLQEMSFHALRAQSQFQMGTNFTAWLYRIMRNDFITSRRSLKRAPQALDDEIANNVADHSGDQESAAVVKEVMRAMDHLSPDQREALMLVCVSGWSYEEVAETIGCSIGTVKSRLFRARERMQALLLEETPATEKIRQRPALRDRAAQNIGLALN